MIGIIDPQINSLLRRVYLRSASAPWFCRICTNLKSACYAFIALATLMSLYYQCFEILWICCSSFIVSHTTPPCSRYFYSTTRGFLFQCPFFGVQFIQEFVFLLVQVTGFDSRANCALGLPRSRTSTGSSLCTDSPSNPITFIKQNGRASRTLPFHLVQVTGFEPTRLSTLEPETSASAVPPHLQF